MPNIRIGAYYPNEDLIVHINNKAYKYGNFSPYLKSRLEWLVKCGNLSAVFKMLRRHSYGKQTRGYSAKM